MSNPSGWRFSVVQMVSHQGVHTSVQFLTGGPGHRGADTKPPRAIEPGPAWLDTPGVLYHSRDVFNSFAAARLHARCSGRSMGAGCTRTGGAVARGETALVQAAAERGSYRDRRATSLRGAPSSREGGWQRP
jgi:hypothetical protein